MTVTARSIEILLVEDSPTDRLLTIEALERARVLNSLNTVENGEDAMAYLRREGQFAGSQRPDIILLDLNLPRKDGREVLAEIKSDATLKLIPVIVLTSSSAEDDVMRAYGAQANSFITKPIDLNRFGDALETLGNYWFDVVTLRPPGAVDRVARSAQPRPGRVLLGDDLVKVLLVEDQDTDALLVEDALHESRAFAFALTRVTRLSAAVAMLASSTFDVVLTDLGLPDSSGLDTCRALHAAAGGRPVLVLTGQDDENLGLSALSEGAEDYLVKGELTPRGIARAVRHAIDRHNAEHLLQHAQRMDALGQVAAGVAHDFNNLLTVIKANSAMIRSSGEAELVELATEIGVATDRGAALTRQLLAFSRRQQLKPENVDLNEVVGNFTRVLRRVLGAEVRVESQCTARLPRVRVDVGMLEQVILNLAVNARDAMPSGGRLTLRTSEITIPSSEAKRFGAGAYPGRFVRLAVKDSGEGIAPQHLAKIWEPFFTTKDVNQGTGLGLSTVYGIIHQHRGWIGVQSSALTGTEFEIFLPEAGREELSEASVPRGQGVEDSSAQEATVLLVDDDPYVRRATLRSLNSFGYRVIEASSGPEALQVWTAHEGQIDLLFTDLVMPLGMDGRALAEALVARDPHLMVIFSSGYSDDFGSEEFTLIEDVNFLPKPYSLARLRAIVQRRLAERLPRNVPVD